MVFGAVLLPHQGKHLFFTETQCSTKHCPPAVSAYRKVHRVATVLESGAKTVDVLITEEHLSIHLRHATQQTGRVLLSIAEKRPNSGFGASLRENDVSPRCVNVLKTCNPRQNKSQHNIRSFPRLE